VIPRTPSQKERRAREEQEGMEKGSEEEECGKMGGERREGTGKERRGRDIGNNNPAL
jgi:hypothetical protein